MRKRRVLTLLLLVVVAVVALPPAPRPPRMTAGPIFGKCVFTSPQLLQAGGRALILVAASDGTIAALEPGTGEIAWRHVIEPPRREAVWLLATPAIVEDEVVVAYQTYSLRTSERTSHRTIVIDAETGKPAAEFAPLEIAARVPSFAGGGTVEFDPKHALSRAALAHGRASAAALGYVYVSFGNLDAAQPYHGWVFEIDLDAWKRGGPSRAISAALPTTRDPGCPGAAFPPTSLCGGGVWAPRGPKVQAAGESFALLVPTGNGAFALSRADYSTTLMSLAPGLRFDPGCDEQLCGGEHSTHPKPECAASCANLFVPRLLPGDPPLRPASGACDERDLHECLRLADLDFGSSPVRVELEDGRAVLVQAGKEGALYLVDAEHLGTLYDREQIVELCGTKEEPCALPWAGTIVTEPAVTEVDGTPVVIVPTFMPDHTHPAGLVAVKIVSTGGKPRFEPFWRAPDPSDRAAIESFRLPSSAVTLTTSTSGRQLAWVAEGFNLWAIDVRDGSVVERVALDLRAIRYARPLAHDGRLYVPLCKADDRGARIDSYPYDEVAR